MVIELRNSGYRSRNLSASEAVKLLCGVGTMKLADEGTVGVKVLLLGWITDTSSPLHIYGQSKSWDNRLL
jgi:hypothetical protein